MGDVIEFRSWGKTARYYRDIIVTEKIDGTNAAVIITEETLGEYEDPSATRYVFPDDPAKMFVVGAQSRNRLITPASDNAGFAGWVAANAETLVRDLGPGRHFGEWWGQGIQRKYGMTTKVFSLFNTSKWLGVDFETSNLCHVPVLYEGPHLQEAVTDAVQSLARYGSAATLDFDGHTFATPEGVCVFHTASNTIFKVTLEDDAKPKSAVAAPLAA